MGSLRGNKYFTTIEFVAVNIHSLPKSRSNRIKTFDAPNRHSLVFIRKDAILYFGIAVIVQHNMTCEIRMRAQCIVNGLLKTLYVSLSWQMQQTCILVIALVVHR